MKKWLALVLVAALVIAMAVPAVALAKPGKAFGKPTFVSHPYTKHVRLKVSKDFGVWGYVNTWHRVPLTKDATVTIFATPRGSKVASEGLTTTATVAWSGKFKKKTNYKATMNIDAVGAYYLRAKLVWVDAKGVEHTKWSSRKLIRIVK